MIYTTFKQWVKGRFLEIGEPRKQAYSKDELALIEMGWNYGYDAGVHSQKSQQALDKKADNARELGLDYDPQRTAAEGEDTQRAWVEPREWRGLTEQEAAECWSTSTVRTWQAIEALLKEKNERKEKNNGT